MNSFFYYLIKGLKLQLNNYNNIKLLMIIDQTVSLHSVSCSEPLMTWSFCLWTGSGRSFSGTPVSARPSGLSLPLPPSHHHGFPRRRTTAKAPPLPADTLLAAVWRPPVESEDTRGRPGESWGHQSASGCRWSQVHLMTPDWDHHGYRVYLKSSGPQVDSNLNKPEPRL